VQRLRLTALVVAYASLVLIAWFTGNDLLSALCVVVLVSVVLAPGLRAGTRSAWLAWLIVVGATVGLSALGHGRIAIDLLPLAINLGLGALFAHSLRVPHTPLIARAIIAIEGRERLALPRVAGYARGLTLAWALIFLGQAALFLFLLAGWLRMSPTEQAAHPGMQTWLHVGGYLLPAAFMLAEYAFRRWYLRHLPHMAPQVFLERLLRNWHQLLRDAEPVDGVRNGH
jgi:uncharacterized membrane protein